MPKGTVVGSLLAKLGIDAAEYEAGLDKADRDAQAWSKKFKSTMSTTASYVSAAAAGIRGAILGIGFAGATQAIRETVAAIASLGDEAKRAGLSIRAFQEWKFVAEQNRIGIDAMVDGFKELNLRADEFIATGGGSAAEAFQRLGYSAEDLKEKLKDPSALMLDIIERLRQLDSAAQIRIFDELLGGSGGEQFVQLIGQGADGIRKTIERAHELGRVFSDKIVKGADETNRKFNDLMGTLTTWVQGDVVQFANELADAYANLSGIFDLVQRMRDKSKPPEDQQSTTIQSSINTLMRERLYLTSALKGAEDDLAKVSPDALDHVRERAEMTVDDLTAKIVALNAEEDNLIKILNGRQEGTAPTPAVPNITGPKTPLPPERPEEADKAYEAYLAKQKAESDAILARVQSVRDALMTEEEAERASYERRLEILKEGLENKKLTEEEYDQLKIRAHQDLTEQLGEITKRGVEEEMRIREQLVGNASDILGSLASLSESFGKKGFVAAKAFGIAQAVINTAEGITKALAQGGILGFAGAAAVAAAGAAQIATIARTNPGSSSRPSVSKSGATDTSSSAGGDGGGADPTKAIYLSLQGKMFSRESVEDLFRQFVDMQKDGYKLIID